MSILASTASGLLNTPTPITASVMPICLIAAAAVGLLAAWRVGSDRLTVGVMIALCIAGLVATARLMAERIGLDLIDLSSSAARAVGRELSITAMIVGVGSLAIGWFAPKVLGRMTSSTSLADRTAYLAIVGGAIWLLATTAAVAGLSGVSRTAGASALTVGGVVLAAVVVAGVMMRSAMTSARSLYLVLATLGVWGVLAFAPRGSESSAVWHACMAAAAIGGLVLAATGLRRTDHTSQPMPKLRQMVASVLAISAVISVPGVLDTARRAFETEAKTYVTKHPPKALDDSPIAAVCIGTEKFAIVLPAMGENGADLVLPGMLLDRSQFADPQDLEHLEVGTLIPASPVGADLEAKRYQLKAKIAHGDHFHDYDFAIVNASKAELRELAMMFGAQFSSKHLLVGLLSGVCLTILAARSMQARLPKLVFAGMFLIAAIVPVLGGVGGAIGLIAGATIAAVAAFRD